MQINPKPSPERYRVCYQVVLGPITENMSNRFVRRRWQMPTTTNKFFLSFVYLLAVANLAMGQSSSQKTNLPLSAERLFSPDRVTEIQIELNENDWDEIRSQTRTFGEALTKQLAENPFTYVKGNITIDGTVIKDVGIRKKGFLGSLNTERPSLKIKFKQYTDQTPVAGLDRLTLNNNNQDAARVCQFISYKMYRDSGTIAPRCGFTKVTVNGKYLGIYSNVESIKADFLRRSYGDSSGELFEGTVADFFPNWIQKFEAKNKQASLSSLQKISEVLQEDELDFDTLGKLIDVDAFIRFWAMESLLGFWDGYCSNQNNFFIYRHPKNEKFYFIPWGTDSCLSDSFPFPPYRIRPRSVHAKAIIPNRLYRSEESKADYIETLKTFLDKHWQEEELLAELQRLEKMLRPHLLEDNRSFDQTLDGYREFIRGRRAAIESEFKDGPPELKSREKQPVYFVTVGTAEVSFKTKWFTERPKAIPGIGEATVNLIVDGKPIELTDVGVFAKTDDRNESNAAIVVVGQRVSNKKTIILAASMPKSQFNPGDKPIPVGGILMQPSSLGMWGGKMRMASGTANLKQASIELGKPIEGTLSLTITKMKGTK